MTQVTQASRPSQRERRKSLFMLLTGLFLLLYAASLMADILLAPNLFWLTAAFITAMGICAFGWARNLDEAKLTAHYEAWYWGGSLGIMVSGLVFLALLPTMLTPGGFDSWLPEDLHSVTANLTFVAGLMLGTMPAVIGYVIWWVVLWAQRG